MTPGTLCRRQTKPISGRSSLSVSRGKFLKASAHMSDHLWPQSLMAGQEYSPTHHTIRDGIATRVFPPLNILKSGLAQNITRHNCPSLYIPIFKKYLQIASRER